jgi:ATP-dependent helicase HrpB
MIQENFPILEIIDEVKNKLSIHNTLVLQAPPGAGKSTILPLEIRNCDWLAGKKMIMLEPRRLAARSVAQRMASLLDEEVGQTIGYRIRFENKISVSTQIEVVTEGILTRMLQQDNSLEEVGLVIFDEFHERSLHADLALALCREIQQVLREDLKILIMSATLDGEKISNVLGNVPILTSQGRHHPISINYLKEPPDQYIIEQIGKLIRKAFSETEGDILAFLPGAGEILRIQNLLESELPNAMILPLYGDLPFQKQQEAILPDKFLRRKIVLATSIAETSLTIEGIKVVVDSGLSRVPRFDPRTGLTKLETVRVTKDAADQRAGRAGRLGPGTCYRMWTEGSHQHLIPTRVPEILEADLAPMLLELLHWGIKDLGTLSWITPPPAGAVNQAKDLLTQLKAISDNRITEKGIAMLKLPTHPRIAHMLLEAEQEQLLSIAIDIAALLEERDPLGKEAGVNLHLRLEALRKWRNKEYIKADKNILERIERLASSWRRILKIKEDNAHVSASSIGKILSYAYPERIAKKREHESYRLANGRIAKLPNHDPLLVESWITIAHLDSGIGEGKIYIAAPIDSSDIQHLMEEKEVLSWDGSKGILIARKEKRIGEIVFQSSPIEKINPEEKIKVLCAAIKKEGKSLLPWTDQVEEWQARVLSLKQWRANENWPDVTTEFLISTVKDWLAPYLNEVRRKEDFQKLELVTILQSTMPWDLQQKVDELAPQKIKVPSGSVLKLEYKKEGTDPVLSVRLQEMFGLLETPTINEGKTKVLLHLLSPGYKPVQVTQDLKSFWQNTYPEVRKELRIRYPKHHWPEDPWTAEAVRGVKKKNS